MTLEMPQGHIKFEDIVFSYSSRKGQPVLNGISWEAKPSETIALVGHSGCGKSTSVSKIRKNTKLITYSKTFYLLKNFTAKKIFLQKYFLPIKKISPVNFFPTGKNNISNFLLDWSFNSPL